MVSQNEFTDLAYLFRSDSNEHGTVQGRVVCIHLFFQPPFPNLSLDERGSQIIGNFKVGVKPCLHRALAEQ